MLKYVPNILSLSRVAAMPFLLYLAWIDKPSAFLILFGIALFTDFIDGTIARKLKVDSDLGTKLDSYGDFAIYMTTPLAVWWLWPEVVVANTFFVVLIVISYCVPPIKSFTKFRKLPSLHLWSAKASSIFLTTSFLILILLDISWPFKAAAFFQAFSSVEELTILDMTDELESNVKSLWHFLKDKEIISIE